MKNGKKTIALILAVVMLLALGVSAMAADAPTKGSISIVRALENETYFYYDGSTYESSSTVGAFELYRIFDATMSFDDEGKPTGYSYTCTDAQKQIPGFGTYFIADEANNVIGVTDAGGSDGELSTEAVQWIKDNIEELGTLIPEISEYTWRTTYNRNPDVPYYTDDYIDGQYNAAHTYHNLPFGYYFVNSTVGSAVMINSTQPDVVIQDKNQTPTLNKKISQITNSNGETRDGEHDPWVKNEQHYALAQIGDTVSYDITVHAVPTAERYVLSDSMVQSLTLQPSTVKLYVNDSVLSPDNYTLLTDAGNGFFFNRDSNGTGTIQKANGDVVYTFQGVFDQYESIYLPTSGYYNNETQTYYNVGAQIVVIFNQDYLDSITEGTDIVLKYDAVINVNAANGPVATQNSNQATLNYGHTYNLYDNANVESLQLVVYKYEGSDASSSSASRPLNGVGFVLAREDGKYFKQDPDTLAITWVENINEATKLVTGPQSLWAYGGYGYSWYQTPPMDGYLFVDGLTGGTYTLIETEPLPGFNRVLNVTITLPTGPMPGYYNTPTFRTQVNVANKTGTLLPSTGGVGVTVVYELGLAVLAFGVILMLTKKQKGSKA